MKIDNLIEAYSSVYAFGILLSENPDIGSIHTDFIDITDIIGSKSIEQYKGLGLLFCVKISELGENTNKVQFKIDETIETGVRSWITSYVLIPDFKTNNKTLSIDNKIFYELKSEAEKQAKEWCAKNKKDVHIKMIKRLKEHSPVNTSILYRMSLKQVPAVYHFFN